MPTGEKYYEAKGLDSKECCFIWRGQQSHSEEVLLEQHLGDRRHRAFGRLEKTHSRQGKSECQGPEVGPSLECSEWGNEVNYEKPL